MTVARIRTIKPDFFRHEALYELERETGLPLRVAFAGLWTAADREGRFEWRPLSLKLDCLPFDEIDFSRVLDALESGGFVVKYRAVDKFYGYIPSWRRHQVINNRETKSKLPDPSEINNLPTRQPREDDAKPTRLTHAQGEGEGEGEGKESTPSVVIETTATPEPAAGVVPADAGTKPQPQDPEPCPECEREWLMANAGEPPRLADGPRHIAAGLSLDALRVTPAVETPLESACGALWAVLAANSVKGTASHPAVVEMARSGVTIAELRTAIAEARKNREGQLNPAYLAAIVERIRTEGSPQDRKAAAAWTRDDRALEAKAREEGLTARAGESYAELRARVRQRVDEKAREAVR